VSFAVSHVLVLSSVVLHVPLLISLKPLPKDPPGNPEEAWDVGLRIMRSVRVHRLPRFALLLIFLNAYIPVDDVLMSCDEPDGREE